MALTSQVWRYWLTGLLLVIKRLILWLILLLLYPLTLVAVIKKGKENAMFKTKQFRKRNWRSNCTAVVLVSLKLRLENSDPLDPETQTPKKTYTPWLRVSKTQTVILLNCVNNNMLVYDWILTALTYGVMVCFRSKLSDLTCSVANICNRITPNDPCPTKAISFRLL